MDLVKIYCSAFRTTNGIRITSTRLKLFLIKTQKWRILQFQIDQEDIEGTEDIDIDEVID